MKGEKLCTTIQQLSASSICALVISGLMPVVVDTVLAFPGATVKHLVLKATKEWDGAVAELMKTGTLELIGTKGGKIYKITDKGYEVVDSFK